MPSGRSHVPLLRNADQCGSCKKGRYSPPVVIKVTETGAITPYLGVHGTRRGEGASGVKSPRSPFMLARFFFKESQPKGFANVQDMLGGGSNRRRIHVRLQLTCGRDATR
jgi:hypothetical protein